MKKMLSPTPMSVLIIKFILATKMSMKKMPWIFPHIEDLTHKVHQMILPPASQSTQGGRMGEKGEGA